MWIFSAVAAGMLFVLAAAGAAGALAVFCVLFVISGLIMRQRSTQTAFESNGIRVVWYSHGLNTPAARQADGQDRMLRAARCTICPGAWSVESGSEAATDFRPETGNTMGRN